MPFISLFYPASDAAEHFVEGQHLEIAGPMFRTYAEAVRELEQETSDVFEQGLPVEPYVLAVKALRGGGGYSIVEVYEVSFPTMRGGARAHNPREPKLVEMPELRGIRTGADQQFTLDEAAAVYGDFMAHNLPLGVPASKVRRAFGAAVTPPSVERHRHEAAAIKQKAVGKISSSVTKAVEAHGVDGAKALTEEKLGAVAEALDAGQITAAQAAPIIALESKRLEILDILQRFCPPVGEEGAAAIYEVTRAIFGGDEAAAEAGRLVLESVSNRFSARPVEVDHSAVPALKKGRTASKAAKTSAADAAVFTGDVGAFVKAYGSRIRGDAKLVKAIVANAVGLAPFPVGFPVAELRDATSDVYALLAEAGVNAQPQPTAQFDDPGLQAIYGGMPVPPLPAQPDDFIIRQYSYETGSPAYSMRYNGMTPPDETPDLAQAIAVAERMGVQTAVYYDTAMPGGGADFRPIAEAFERNAEDQRRATPIVAMPVPEPPPALLVESAATRRLAAAQRAKREAVLNAKTYFRGEYVTHRQMHETLLGEGATLAVKMIGSSLPRDQLSRMSNEEHTEWKRKALKRGLVPEYRINRQDGTYNVINKTMFDDADQGGQLSVTVNAGSIYPSPAELHRLEHMARLKYPEIFARQATAPDIMHELEPEPPPSASAEERLAAKIAAANDAGLARLQAMLNG